MATPQGERHELSILCATGFGMVYLGADLPIEEIAEAATRARTAVVVRGLTTMSAAHARVHPSALRAHLRAGVETWTGGAAARSVKGARMTPTLEAFARQLAARDR